MKKLIALVVVLICTLKLSAQETERFYLSGTGSDNTKNWDFFCSAGMNSGKWTTIGVPSCWEQQGFGAYNYGFSPIAKRLNEEGQYRYRFNVPSGYKGKTVNIVFEGVMTDAEVKINGKLAGATHQGSFYVFRYDISKLLKYGGENLLEVKVAKHSKNESVNEAERKADFWLFGGIFRPVFLEVLPQSNIERVQIDAKANGEFKANVYVKGNADKLELEVLDATGKRFGKNKVMDLGSAEKAVELNKIFENPLLWSSEFPNLYTAKFTLFKKGKVLHTISKKIGFRTIEVKSRDGVYVNGVKIKFKGVNRHSFWPESGRTTNKTISINDVLLMKEMNVNAVRMSHYPPDGHFLDVCDSLGLYVMDELGGWHGHYDTPTGTKLVKEMFQNDENHPSIVFWANGNEGGHNRELDYLFADQDIQKRPLIHPWEIFGDFETTHYREYNYGIGNYDNGHHIVMPTEFLHGMWDGGHGAGIEDYWKAMWQNPLSAGGFLWCFSDEGVVRRDKNGEIDTDGNHGPDGIVGPHHEKEGSFYTIKEVWSPVFIEHRELAKGFDGTFNIENRYSFTNINQCSFEWKLKRLSRASEDSEYKSGKAIAPDIKPYAKGVLKLDLPEDWATFDALYLTAKSPEGKEIYTWSYPIKLPFENAQQAVVKTGNQKINLKETASNYEVSANGINISIDKNSGLLQKVSNRKGTIPFNNGPILQEGENNFKGFTVKQTADSLVIASTFDKKASYNTLQWVVYPSGWVKMQVKYFPSSYFTTFVGCNFSYPESEIKGVEFKGRGPYRVWKNRMKGTSLGVFDKTYNTSATGEPPFDYPEFKGYYSNLYWAIFKGKSQDFKVVTDHEDIFLRLFTPKKSKDTEYDNLSPTFPNGDISFMNAISAIGTKTQKPETTGPMGMKNIYYDFDKAQNRTLDMTLYFDFSGM